MGPTNFAGVLRQCKRQVVDHGDSKTFHICLILTDGEIHDMPKTIELLSALSSSPCSVIIVGVGEDEFANMRKLDGDGLDKLPGAVRDVV